MPDVYLEQLWVFCQTLEIYGYDCEITWGAEGRDLSPFAGRTIRLQIRVDSLYAYRFA